ncbi:MAG: hypothetical protein J0H57_03930 [Rhodospirillales bacterium]|nr:hypothetical protein [Rhodospirillales bacterium]
MQITAVTALFADLPEGELRAWIARGWIRPEPAAQEIAREVVASEGQEWEFEEIDIARVRLVYDLRRAMEIQEDTVPLVLSLLDQVYALRGELRLVLRAIDAQPAPVRESIRALLRR